MWLLPGLISIAVLALHAAGSEEAYIRRGMELRDAGSGAAAIDQFRRAIGINPKLPAIHREIGLLLLDQRDFSGAAAAFRNAWSLAPEDLDSRYNHALAVANSGDPAESLRLLGLLAAQKPAFALGYFGLGHVHAMEGRFGPAEENFREALRLDPSLFRAWFELGRLLERKGDATGAVGAYRTAVSRKPDFGAARYRLAILLKASGDLSGAASELDRVKQLAERRAGGERAGKSYLAGLALFDGGRFGDAVRELEEARSARPDFEEIGPALAAAYVAWAVEAERAGDVAEAVRRFTKAVAIEPDPETENHTGVLLAKAGRISEAASRFRSALAMRPDYESARRNLDRALLLMKQDGAQPRR
ncbi:MAG: tetratricopeptide repeat protein [Acidobacteria bacterium]|nr:tetratricopeptide repeat protein [Acidobacteriota bacterium]